MRVILAILTCFCFSQTQSQPPVQISGRLLDSAGNPIEAAGLYYGSDLARKGTAYSDKEGRFSIRYSNPDKLGCYLYIEKQGFLPKTVTIAFSPGEVRVDTTIVLRSRREYWYDGREIDSSHLGLTVRQTILRYKLDISDCHLIEEPIGFLRGFSAELGDSSYLYLMIDGHFSKRRQKMADILDATVIGIGVAFTNGEERYFGRGLPWRGIGNWYFWRG